MHRSCGRKLLLAAGLAVLIGCQSHRDKSKRSADQIEGRNPKGSSPRSVDDRIPKLTGEAVGMLPGYTPGGFAYAHARLGSIQSVVRSLLVNVNAAETEELVEIAAKLGIDTHSSDLLGPLGLDPNARISVTLRPILDHELEVRSLLDNRDPVIEEISKREGDRFDAEQAVARPPLSDAARDFEQKSSTLGVHVRVHVPTGAPQVLAATFDRLATMKGPTPMWEQTCAVLGPSELCVGDSSRVAVIRAVPGGFRGDIFFLAGGGAGAGAKSESEATVDPIRTAVIKHALALPIGASRPEVPSLRGDVAVLVDGATAVATARLGALMDMVAALRWSGISAGFRQHHDKDQALAQLHPRTQRMFEGVRVEASLTDDGVVATAQWLTSEHSLYAKRTVFELSPVDADVPRIAELCSGALVCGRSRGIWARERFIELATGVYARPETTAKLIADHEQQVMLVLLLGAWPNALGTITRLSDQYAEGTEAYMIQTGMDIAQRQLGFGFSIRSHDSLTDDWVAYARMIAADLGTLTSVLQLANSRLSSTTIDGVDGRVESMRIPNNTLPGNLYAIFDPAAATGGWGWAVIADADERVAWLAKLARDDGAVPIAYLEATDLLQVLALADPNARKDLEFAKPWLSRRWARVQLAMTPEGLPELRFASGQP